MRSLPVLALALAASATAAPAPTLPALKTAAAPIWRTYTRDHTVYLAKSRQRVRVAFAHDAAKVRYAVSGSAGSVSSAGLLQVSAPCPSEEAARSAAWVLRRRTTLILHFNWRDKAWQPGPVEWKNVL